MMVNWMWIALLKPSHVTEIVTFETETETWLKLRDRDFIKNPETRDFRICAICRNILCRDNF